ncbi:MAG: universal stress protein [Pseudomonadota bacterium]
MPSPTLLFKSFKIDNISLKNRITMAPLFTGYAHLDGTVSELILDHYKELAQGGTAMIVVGNVSVHSNGLLSRHSLRADDDKFMPGLCRLAEAIKKDSVSVLQINHGGRFARTRTAYAPSNVPVEIEAESLGGLYRTALKPLDMHQQLTFLSEFFSQRPNELREMSKKDIKETTKAYADAAVRAREAGFDIVEIHGGTGYLPVQFLSPRTNKRKDKYGGDLQGRMRFVLELVEEIKDAVGYDYPVGYRFLADEWLPGGFTLEEAKVLAVQLELRHIAYLSITAGTYESFFAPEMLERARRPGYMTDLARDIRSVVSLPVIATGRITTPDVAEDILVRKDADLIGLARPLLADPQWAKKAKDNKDAIVLCTDCGTCLRCAIADRPVVCSQWDKIKTVQRKNMIREIQNPHKKVLITIDNSENGILGAAYVANMLGRCSNIKATLFHVQTDETYADETGIQEAMNVARSILIKGGIPEKSISIQVQKKDAGIGNDILNEIEKGGYGTVVVGRRDVSRAHQLFFGSVASKIMQNAKNCTIWIVE